MKDEGRMKQKDKGSLKMQQPARDSCFDSSFLLHTSSLRRWSYAWCERLARRAAGNFYHAFRILPADQRRAMCALYAFMRITDDLGDGDAPTEIRRAALGA